MLSAVRPTFAIPLTLGYLIGSTPIADLVAGAHGVSNLRAQGDHNPGFWNAKGLIGTRAAIPIFVGDIAKGAAAASIGQFAASSSWGGYVGGGAAMVGHSFPAFTKLRGGRSVLTFVGAALVFAPKSAAIAAALTATTWAATQRFDVAARFGVAAFPLIQLRIEGATRTAATGALMTFIGARFVAAAIAVRSDDPSTSSTA